MLLGNKANPGRQVAAGREGFPIAYFRPQSCGDDRANAGDLLEPPAFGARAVPGMDALLNDPISAAIATYCRARTSRLNRAAAGMQSSFSVAMILSSSAVPLRPFAEIMPSSAICPRIALDSIVR